jgi:hypothetical protein
MRRAILTEIEVKNFMGVDNFSASFDAVENTISAANGTGKTTVMLHAPNWMLFGINGFGDTKFRFKPIDKTNEDFHVLNIETSVSCKYDVDGEEISFQKTATDEYTKKDSNGVAKFKANKIRYFLNEFEVSATEYKSKVDELFDSEAMKMLGQTHYFMNLHWEKQREFLMRLVPGIDDKFAMEESKNDKYSYLAPFIAKSIPMSDVKKRASTEITKQEKIRDEKTGAIEENKNWILGLSVEAEKAKLAELTEKLAKFESLKTDVSASVSEKINERAEIEAKIDTFNRIISEQNEIVRSRQSKYEADNLAEYNKHKTEIENSAKKQESLKAEIKSIEEKIEQNKQSIKDLLSELTIARAKSFNASAPVCQHGFAPCQSLIESFEKDSFLLAEKFANNKASQIEAINQKGCKFAADRKELDSKLHQVKDELALLESIEHSEPKIAKHPDFTDEYTKIENAKESIKELVEKLASFTVSSPVENIEEIELKSQIDVAKKIIADAEKEETVKARNIELEKEKMVACDTIADLMQKMIVVDEFVADKMKLIESKVNSMFTGIKFSLFERNQNGSYENKCLCLYNGVPYSHASHSERVKMGIAFINTASDFLNMYYPVCIDDRELVSILPEMKTQVFHLRVNNDFKIIQVS